jgi:hypothetical protein
VIVSIIFIIKNKRIRYFFFYLINIIEIYKYVDDMYKPIIQESDEEIYKKCYYKNIISTESIIEKI